MSDLFLSTGIDVDHSLLAREMCFTPYTTEISGKAAGVTWSISRVDDMNLWGPAFDTETKTRVLLGGRIALEEHDWVSAEALPYLGGLAAKHILSGWLNRGHDGVADYNGAALIAIIDEQAGQAHIWTDRMGFFPAFVTSAGGLIVASHPDVIAQICAANGTPLSIDETTIAEYLHTGTAFHPYTLWREVQHLDAGSEYLLSTQGLRKLHTYWRPGFLEGEKPVPSSEFIETFAAAFRAAGRRRSLPRLGRTALLLSAGSDSRGVLASTMSPCEVHCYTYFDEPNSELSRARRIAELAGSKHFGLQRTPDYYVANAEETIRLAGGMWGFDAGHHTAFAKTIRECSDVGTVLTGEFCDLLFKGIALNRQSLRLFGRDLPLHKLAAFQHEYYLPFSPISPEWSAKVDERLDRGVPIALRTDADPRKIEYARLAPCSQLIACSSVLWRTLPFDVFVADNDILEAFGRLSIPDKISGIAFGRAIARVAGDKLAAVPNNYGSAVGASELGRATSFLLSSAGRKLRHFIGAQRPKRTNPVATEGSWPDLVNVALISTRMRAWYDDISERHGDTLVSYLHPSRRAWSFEEFVQRDNFQFYRLMSLSLWMRQQSIR